MQSIWVMRTFHAYLEDCDVIIMSDTDEPPALGSTGKYTENKTKKFIKHFFFFSYKSKRKICNRAGNYTLNVSLVYYFLNQNNSFVDFKHGVWLKNVKKGNGNKKTIFVTMDHVGIRFADPVQLQVQVAG